MADEMTVSDGVRTTLGGPLRDQPGCVKKTNVRRPLRGPEACSGTSLECHLCWRNSGSEVSAIRCKRPVQKLSMAYSERLCEECVCRRAISSPVRAATGIDESNFESIRDERLSLLILREIERGLKKSVLTSSLVGGGGHGGEGADLHQSSGPR